MLTILSTYVSFYNAAIILGLVGFAFVLREAVLVDDPYSSYHIALNVRPGDEGKKRPKTEWINMGYWEVQYLIYSELLFIINDLGN
jgi:hypothetical protein